MFRRLERDPTMPAYFGRTGTVTRLKTRGAMTEVGPDAFDRKVLARVKAPDDNE